MTFQTRLQDIRVEVKANLLIGLGFLGFATLLLMWHLEPVWKNTSLDRQLVAIAGGGGLALLGLVAHELAHVWMGQRLKLGLKYLRFSGLVGGAHVRKQRPQTPRQLFELNVVGPVANLLLAGGLVGLSMWESGLGGEARWATFWMAAGQIQLLFAGLQLLPMFPGDGGKMMEAGLWSLLKRRGWAIVITTIVGSLLAGGAMWAWGWWAQGAAFYPDITMGSILGVMVAGGGFWQGYQYYHLHQGLDQLQNYTVRDATEFFPVSLTTSDSTDFVIKLDRPTWITAQGQRLGAIHDGLDAQDRKRSIEELMCPLEEALTVSAEQNLGELMERLGRNPDRVVIVEDPHLGEGLLSLRQVFQQAGWDDPR